MQIRTAISIYPIISEEIENLKIAEKKLMHIINAIVILRQIESHFLKFAIAISSLTSFLYFVIRIDIKTKRKKANIPMVF